MIFVVLSITEPIHHTGYSALGHEIHLTRFILLDMLNKGYINNEITLVTCNIDRKFLYTKIFNNIISYDNFVNMEINNNNVINLWPFTMPLLHEIDVKYINEFKNKSEYPIEDILYNTNLNYLNNLIDKIEFQSINENIYKNNLFYINSLHEYCSLINNNKCIAVISELSGGGEISQYCHNNLIYHYQNSYSPTFIEMELSNYKYLNLHNDWNFHNCSTARLIRNNINVIFEHMIDNIPSTNVEQEVLS